MTNYVQESLHHIGIAELSEMQHAFVEKAPTAHELLLLSPTGSGKTLAYLLGILRRQREEASMAHPGSVVIIHPSRELARQSYDLWRRMKTDIPAACFIGGHTTASDSETLSAVRPHLLFVTPGRLLDLLRKQQVEGEHVRLLVIDEYDKCLDDGFTEELEQIRTLLPTAVDTWLLSATTAPAHLERFIHVEKAFRLDYGTDNHATPRLSTVLVPSPEKDKLSTLGALLTQIQAGTQPRPVIVFVGYRESVERVFAYLRSEGFSAERYHGGMEQAERERSLLRFRCGGSLILVATDLAARGIDIPEVGGVISYHLPADAELFEHRSGRSTRWKNSGTSYLIIGPEEQPPSFLGDTSTLSLPAEAPLKAATPPCRLLYIGRGKREKLSRGDIAGFLCKKGGLRATDIGRIEVGEHQAYVAIQQSCLKRLLTAISGEKIKGMKTLIEEARF
jgi:superfamily II DNA/RNA helicase